MPFNTFLLPITFILLHGLLFALNYYIHERKIMQPAVLFSLLWLIIIIAHLLFRYTILDQLFALHSSTYLVLFLGVVAFSTGSFLQTVYWQKTQSEQQKRHPWKADLKLSKPVYYIFLFIAIAGLPFYIVASYRLFLISNIDNFFVGLRTQLVYGNSDLGLTKYLISFSFVVFAIYLFSYFNNRSWKSLSWTIISFLITITYVIFFTGRGLFLMILALFFGISYIKNNRFSITTQLPGLLLFVVLFVFFGILYGKSGSRWNSFKENIEPVTQSTAIYLVSSLNALDIQLADHFGVDYSGNNSLRLFRILGEKLGLVKNQKIKELESEFVLVPYPTNVYTVYSPYLRDFGKAYALIMIALFGALHSWTFNMALKTRDLRFTLYYAFLLFPLLISFFMDFYLTIFSTWIQIVFYIELFIFLNEIFQMDRHAILRAVRQQTKK